MPNYISPCCIVGEPSHCSAELCLARHPALECSPGLFIGSVHLPNAMEGPIAIPTGTHRTCRGYRKMSMLSSSQSFVLISPSGFEDDAGVSWTFVA